uniref:Uncharacterized protein n=1 Tax=Octopus bimaculoides TaxID=37653 RepID=A0A0L8H0M2_OCTBM
MMMMMMISSNVWPQPKPHQFLVEFPPPLSLKSFFSYKLVEGPPYCFYRVFSCFFFCSFVDYDSSILIPSGQTEHNAFSKIPSSMCSIFLFCTEYTLYTTVFLLISSIFFWGGDTLTSPPTLDAPFSSLLIFARFTSFSLLLLLQRSSSFSDIHPSFSLR